MSLQGGLQIRPGDVPEARLTRPRTTSRRGAPIHKRVGFTTSSPGQGRPQQARLLFTLWERGYAIGMAAQNKSKGPAEGTVPVTQQFLLEGAWHALDQAGRLLQGASILFDAGDSSTALAVAMFGREELGRSKLLRHCAREVRGGSSMSAQEVKRRTDNHVKKQAAGALSTVMRMRPGSAAWTAATDASRIDIPDEKRAAAHETVRTAFEAKTKNQPQARHDDRCSALYVDLNALGTEWRRPSAIGREDARNSIAMP